MIEISSAVEQPAPDDTATSAFLTFRIEKQVFGLPLLSVEDVLDVRPLTPIPLAPPEIAGALNLRGRIITAIDMRNRMKLPHRAEGSRYMSIVVGHGDELFNLIVDSVGDVLHLPAATFEQNPPTLDPLWREFSEGVYRLDRDLMLVIDVPRLLTFDC